MTSEPTTIGAGESSPAPGGSAGPWKFPVNRHDEPRLYPGSTRYEGFAALFTLGDGTEYAILAPTLDALDAAVQEHGIRAGGDPVDRGMCAQVEIKRMPNDGREVRGDSPRNLSTAWLGLLIPKAETW